MDQTLHENYENWYPTKIKPSTVISESEVIFMFLARNSRKYCVKIAIYPLFLYIIIIRQFSMAAKHVPF